MVNIETAPLRSPASSSSLSTSSEGFWVSYGLATFIYLAGAALTRPIFISDTLQYLRTATPGNAIFWDFGHLLWRPFLWFIVSHLRPADRSDQFLQAFYILDVLSTAAGLAAIWLSLATLRLFTRRIVVISISTTLLSFSQGVLTHSKGGCAYIFGLLALSAGFYVLLAATQRGQGDWSSAVLSGGLLALSVCLWFPYIFALPGVLSAPVLFFEPPRKQWELVARATMLCAIFGVVTYGAVAIHLGIPDFRSFVAWALASSHGITTSGISRVLFGFARSFVALGQNGARGVAFKRFLLHDPYNPVRFWQVIGLPFWEIVLFYALLALMLRSLAGSSQGLRALLQLLITSLVVLGFAAVWAGTDLERYLPLFPSLMLVMGLALDRVQFPSVTAFVVVVLVATLVVVNVSTLSRRVRDRQLQALTGIVRSLNQSLPSDSLVLLPPVHPLQRIYWDFPEALPLAEHNLKLERLVDLDTSYTPMWRTWVCSQMSQRWKKRIPVAIESSLMQKTPDRDSLWVEGGDPRVSWRDINTFTSQLELGDRIGNTDFFSIPGTARNTQAIDHCLAD